MNNDWDKYFLGMCEQVGTNTKCMSRQIGAILVRDKSIIATGYNGPPRGIPHCYERYFLDEKLQKKILEEKQINIEDRGFNPSICPRRFLGFKSGEGLEWCVAAHAERNCLIDAARRGVKVKGATMCMDCGIPCGDCFIEIINAGISELVCTKLTYYDYKSQYLHKHSDIRVRIFNHLKNAPTSEEY